MTTTRLDWHIPRGLTKPPDKHDLVDCKKCGMWHIKGRCHAEFWLVEQALKLGGPFDGGRQSSEDSQ